MVLTFTLLFVAFLLVMVGVKYWLALRQIRHVARHADRVPALFADRITLDAHQRAAAYTVAKQRLGMVQTAASAFVLVALTLLGGLQWLAELLQPWLGSGLLFQVAIVALIVALISVLDLPFEWHRQFRIEQAFGFNRMTPALFLSDSAKSFLLAAALGLPITAVVLWLMQSAGDLWWLYAWLVWVVFNALVLVLYPTVIAPLFNKFEPLADATLAERIHALLERTGFSTRGVFVMDGSRRSSHGNAYFRTGPGQAHRLLRHADRAVAAVRDRGRARSRTGSLQAQARGQAAGVLVHRQPGLPGAARLADRAAVVLPRARRAADAGRRRAQ
jgi:STE24 endopeptidase